MELFRFSSCHIPVSLAAYVWTPAGEARGMVQISHGMCEYLPRYEEFAQFLCEQGYIVFGHDHLGHGNSVVDREDLGFVASSGGAECMIRDILSLSQLMKERYPTLPLCLFGHSMGSFLARAALTRREASVYSAAIICGTGGPDMPTGAGKCLANLLAGLFGERHRSKLLKRIAFAGYLARIEKPCDPNAWLSRDDRVVQRYNADELCGFTFTVRAYGDLFDAVGEVSRKEWAQKMPKELPLLLISGEEDPVGSFGKGVRKVEDRLHQAGVRDVQCNLYPQMRHEILNELEKETVWEDVLQWLNKH